MNLPLLSLVSVIRSRWHLAGVVMLLTLLAEVPAPAGENFSSPRAYANLRIIAGEIGPRPMGSPAEQRALAFAVERFMAYGCDTAYVMPMTAPSGVNTRSGIAVGIAHGTSGRIIVIGSHMDSSGPDIPGANDDGSGAACVIELCRVLTPRDLKSTLVFCCFGGEEEGLYGSTHFVETFPLIDSVALMLQLDMADGASYLELDPDAPLQVSAPRWLPEAAMDVFTNELGFTGLVYLTHTSTVNASGEAGNGSDHIPFLLKGIPAIDFTSDVGYPIHTPLDNLAMFDSSGLVRSGLLAQKLVERFDQGVPPRSTEQYYLVQLGTHLLFFDHLILWIFLAVAVGTAIAALIVLRTRLVRDPGQPRWSGLKLAVFALVLQVCIWMPETIMGVLRGYRFPWVNNYPLYVVLAILCGLIGVWGILNWVSRWRVHANSYMYFLQFTVALSPVLGGAALINPELALYAVWPLFFVSIAVIVRPGWLKAVLFVLASILPLQIVFPEALALLQRGLSGSMMDSLTRDIVRDLVFITVFTVASLVFAYAFAAVYRSAREDLFWLRKFRTLPVLLVLGAAAAGLGGYLMTTPVYNESWPRSLRLDQRYVYGTDSSTVRLQGSESIAGTRVWAAGKDSILGPGTTNFQQTVLPPSGEWLTVDQTNAVLPDRERPDSLVHIERVLDLYGGLRPLSVSLRYRGDKAFSASSPWSFGSRRRGGTTLENIKAMNWYAFPELPLRIPVSLQVDRGQRIIETLEVTYDTLATDVRATAPLAMLRKRFTITRQDTLQVGYAE